jgi:hypothetical protein
VGRPVLPSFLLSSGRYLPAAFRRREGQRGQEEDDGEDDEGGQFQQQWGRGRGRGRGRRGGASASVELVKAKPVMFDAWIGRRRTSPLRSADILKWEAESVVSCDSLFFKLSWFAEAVYVALLRDSVHDGGSRDCVVYG